MVTLGLSLFDNVAVLQSCLGRGNVVSHGWQCFLELGSIGDSEEDEGLKLLRKTRPKFVQTLVQKQFPSHKCIMGR